MKTKLIPIRFALSVALMAAVTLSGVYLAWGAERPMQKKAGKMEACKQMMQERQQMMSEMKRQDLQLQSMADQLDQASGNEKVDLLGDIVKQMVKNRAAAHEKMQSMQSKMMRHMAQHMQQGGNTMAQCPMMQGMMENMGGPGDDESTPDSDTEHLQHHQGGSQPEAQPNQ